MRLLSALILAALTHLPEATRAETCRLALVMALDVSGSVNDVEYAQQLEGVAWALDSDPVRTLILKSGVVELSVFEWSSQNHQFLIQPWTTLDGHTAIDRAVSTIRSYRKRRAGLKTALSTAMLFASALLEEKNHCWQKKIDVSGDGKNNIGPGLGDVYGLAVFSGVTVNALVVGEPSSDAQSTVQSGTPKDDLLRYYEREVIRGPDAFAMVAHGYEDYARAIRRKLLRELEVPVFGAVQP